MHLHFFCGVPGILWAGLCQNCLDPLHCRLCYDALWCVLPFKEQWLLLHQLHLALACSQGGGLSWARVILWDLWGMVYPSCFPHHSCTRECLHTKEKKKNFVLWNDLIFQKCTFVEVYWGTSCLRAINWVIVSFAFWSESYLRCSTGCTSCLQIKSQPSSFYQKCILTNSLLS